MNQELPFNQWLAQQQANADVSDQQLATALGYESVNVVRTIMAGQMRLPLSKVPELASALDAAPGEVMWRALQEADPALLHAVERCLGALSLSDGEQRLIAAVRRANPGREPVPLTFDRNAVITLVVA